ncbi:hypothetical protein HKBW3S03_01805 [Candidatus Hakubella thermalkaliphila]|uniref:Ribonuclease VapC n=3 Tax=Candidatus Hakubella thermalkaliphila TaxID=2754717 RepID=A0A6V8NJC5_9ACTN|nr:hypothetical protein HKBW3S03_01805 [Candidatus Hakubella thermalkaliphila]GFP23815.1 hypothetical protein HKBW3S09_01280 [Candidatus Hakubella thermalkaliphila]GFP25379.1 hypothetical protein HKBW3S25_00851 [Candidatus Hakubella thermalkaliphila]GFP28093.1 hypothetical protein HKBW3S33_01510 [Candidatus Hakubella thermalkaliphila]GFP29988.1 hypothetical protein HKBW3S34_00908 [Candidatus Hakubella thermalkaliphila]
MVSGKKETKIQRVIFDTDVLIWYFRGNAKAKEFIESIPYEERCISSLIYMELLQGCLNKKELKDVKAFVDENFANIIHPNEVASEKAIALMERFTLSHGLRVVDALVAAITIEQGLQLASANTGHYRFIKDIQLLPFEP